MNSTLYEHGIDADSSDYRVHVCFGEGMVYLYSTAAMRELLLTNPYRIYESPTSRAYIVPVASVPECQSVPIPNRWLENLSTKVSKSSPTSTKRMWSEMLVRRMFERGHLTLLPTATMETSRAKQLAGHDIRIQLDCTVQVKCDWDGGANGSGNLYIETAECNPNHEH